VSRRIPLAVAGILATLVPFLLVTTQSGATAVGTDTSVTKSGSGRFSDLKVTVSQTTHMRNQVVTVSWTGAKQSSTSGRNYFNNYLQIMQCWGDEDQPKREKCQFGGIFDDQRGGQATSSREIVNNGQFNDPNETYSAPFPRTAVVPFESVSGKTVTDKRNEFFDTQSTNEIPYGRTAADGTGLEFFEVQTVREASGLGCGARLDSGGARNCWLVVVPRDDIEVTGQDVDDLPGARLETSPLSASNFANAISFRLDFEPVGVACPIGSAERRLLGNENVAEAITRWQPALCDQTGSIFGFSQLGDDIARSQTLTDSPWMSVVGAPLDKDRNPDNRLLTYAPVSVSGVGLALVIERYPRDSAPDSVKAKRGTRVIDLRLNARIVAKLLTQSYTAAVSGDPKHVAGNPGWLTDDPEFLALNPEFKNLQYLRLMYAVTNPLGLSDANHAIWQWIKADPDARAFIGGKKDPWGARVNPFYKGLDLDRADFPRADPTCTTYQGGQADLCALDYLAYAGDFHAAARAAIRGITLANASWDMSAIPPRYKQNPPQPAGERAVLALVDTATAARYQLPMAQLKNASGQYVAPTQASMKAAVTDMDDPRVDGVLESNPATKVKAAYPLTEVSYALTAPRQLSEDEAKDYADFVRFVAGDGQTPGIAPGQLPEGYLPLPPALRKQAAEAADVIEARGGPEPTDTHTSTPTSSPGSGPETEPGTPSTDVVPPEPVATAAPSSAIPTVTPDPSSLEQVSSATPAVSAGVTRFALLAAVLLGLLVAVARPAWRLVLSFIHRGSSAPTPSTR
jgi:hypothetical protein